MIEINTDFAQDGSAPTVARTVEQLQQIDGVEYILRFHWRARTQTWHVSILDQDENPIAMWIKLVLGSSLLRRFIDPRLPQGLLACYDLSEQSLEIATMDDLGSRVSFAYLSPDEIAAL